MLSRPLLRLLRPSSASSHLKKGLSTSSPASSSSNAFVELPETHRMLRDSVRQFAEGELWPIAAEIDRTGEFPKEQVRRHM